MGTFYSGTMPAALAPEGIEIVGAFCRGQLKSWVHFIAGLCLQPWPEHELKSWAHFKTGIENRAHFIAGLCLQPWPQKALKTWAHFTMGFANRGHIL